MTRASVHLSNVRRISPLVMALKALTLSAERITRRSREAMDVSFRYRMILRLSVDGAKEVIHVSRSIGGTPTKLEDIYTGGLNLLKVTVKLLLCSAMQAPINNVSDHSISNPNGVEAWFIMLRKGNKAPSC
jgi:hypothetical protein